MKKIGRRLAGIVTIGLLLPGCQKGSSDIRPTEIDPAEASQQAITKYDTNQDGLLDDKELKSVVSLASAVAWMDTNEDKKISADEIARQVTTWRDQQLGLVAVYCSVSLDGRPLEGATVTFEPEEFLGESVSPASGVSDRRGDVRITAGGVQPGFYRVTISKVVGGNETIPAKYNTETTLGQVVPSGSRDEAIHFRLRR